MTRITYFPSLFINETEISSWTFQDWAGRFIHVLAHCCLVLNCYFVFWSQMRADCCLSYTTTILHLSCTFFLLVLYLFFTCLVPVLYLSCSCPLNTRSSHTSSEIRLTTVFFVKCFVKKNAADKNKTVQCTCE